MSNQFKNAFIRQLGREFAHDAYKQAGSYESTLSSVDEKSFTAKLLLNPDYGWIAFAAVVSLVCPFLMLIPLVMGIIRLVGPNIRGYYRGTESNYKYDSRCRGGKRYLGKSETWVKAKKPVAECTEEEIKDGRFAGVIEIAISVVVFALMMILWASVF